MIYSYLEANDLYKVSQLSRRERKLIPNNQIVDQPRQMKQEIIRIRKGDFENLKYIIDMATEMPKNFVVERAEDFLDNLFVYQRAYE